MSRGDLRSDAACARQRGRTWTWQRWVVAGLAVVGSTLLIGVGSARALSEATLPPLAPTGAVGLPLAGGAESRQDDTGHVTAEEIAAARAQLRCDEHPFFWCSGGIGVEERAALAALADRFTLCVEWEQRDRPFLAAGRLTVEGERGETLLSLTDVGPWWCGALPAGRYRLVASADPLVEYPPQERVAEVKGTGQRLRLAFLW